MLRQLNQSGRNFFPPTRCKSPPSTRVILVRHGQSTYNAQGRHQGSSDESSLTQRGRYCARQTGAFLRGLEIDAFYGSPLKRARETASELLAAMNLATDNLKVIDHPLALREIDLPAWQGLRHEDVREQFADDYRCWKQHPQEFRMAVPQTEALEGAVASVISQYCFPVLDLYERVGQFWQDVLPRHSGQTLLLVGHSGTNRALISTAIGLRGDRYHTLQQSNCGISILNFPEGYVQKAQLLALNLTSHLDEKLPIPKGDLQGLRLLLVPSETTHPTQIQKLADLIREVRIDFSLNGDFPDSQATAAQMLQYHPEAVQLQVLREDFPQIWQQAIEAKRSTTNPTLENSQPLITGLVIARTATIQYLIGQILGLNSDQRCHLHLRQGSLSVIHYPSSDHSPMLQGMNIASPTSLGLLQAA